MRRLVNRPQSNRKLRQLSFNQPGYLRDKAVSTAVAIALGIIVLLALLIAKHAVN